MVAASELGSERVSNGREHMSQSWEANEFQMDGQICEGNR
jgi:hypothetical protein